jgi:hypothetical protein
MKNGGIDHLSHPNDCTAAAVAAFDTADMGLFQMIGVRVGSPRETRKAKMPEKCAKSARRNWRRATRTLSYKAVIEMAFAAMAGKPRARRCILASVLATTLATPAASQGSPSIQETHEWLRRMVPQFAQHVDEYQARVCKVYLRESFRFGSRISRNYYVIDFRYVENIYGYQGDNDIMIVGAIEKDSLGKGVYEKKQMMSFSTTANRARIINALSNLKRLCRSNRRDPF